MASPPGNRLEPLSSLEFLMQAGFTAAALVLAFGSVRKAVAAGPSSRTGELVWALVAVVVLIGVSAAVHFGGSRGV